MPHFVTSRQAEDHVKPMNTARFNVGVFGDGQYLLKGQGNMECEMVNTNTLRILSGDAMCNGYQWSVDDSFEEVTIETGTPGYKRIDLVVADITTSPQYDISFVAIRGEETTGTPVAPEPITGNLNYGDTHVQQPICEIPFDGINPQEPKMLMNVLVPYEEFRDSQSQWVDITDQFTFTNKSSKTTSPAFSVKTNGTFLDIVVSGRLIGQHSASPGWVGDVSISPALPITNVATCTVFSSSATLNSAIYPEQFIFAVSGGTTTNNGGIEFRFLVPISK